MSKNTGCPFRKLQPTAAFPAFSCPCERKRSLTNAQSNFARSAIGFDHDPILFLPQSPQTSFSEGISGVDLCTDFITACGSLEKWYGALFRTYYALKSRRVQEQPFQDQGLAFDSPPVPQTIAIFQILRRCPSNLASPSGLPGRCEQLNACRSRTCWKRGAGTRVPQAPLRGAKTRASQNNNVLRRCYLGSVLFGRSEFFPSHVNDVDRYRARCIRRTIPVGRIAAIHSGRERTKNVAAGHRNAR